MLGALYVSIQLQISSSVCRTLLGLLTKIEDYLTLAGRRVFAAVSHV